MSNKRGVIPYDIWFVSIFFSCLWKKTYRRRERRYSPIKDKILTPKLQICDNISPIVDVDGLAKILHTTRSNLRNKGTWRIYPHIFIGVGNDLRGARFIVEDVLNYLKQCRGNYGAMEGQESRKVDRKISVQQQDMQKKGIQNQEQSSRMGDRGTGKIKKISTPIGLSSLRGFGRWVHFSLSSKNAKKYLEAEAFCL